MSTAYQTNPLNQYTAIDTDAPQYDNDGNMTQYDGMNLSYNGENRLVAVEPQVLVAGAQRFAFVYDYMGRRVQMTVSTYDGSAWAEDESRLFVYDGWNLIEEIVDDGGAPQSRYFVWGLDLSQSVQGAGGVGGLLAMAAGDQVVNYAFDANGNVGQLVNSNGAIVAQYEYDPFGNTAVAQGSAADDNPYRFSTKYFINGLGMYDYGLRLYEPELGRWLTRDPIEEQGGLNLYGFVGNDGVNGFDLLGMKIKAHGCLDGFFKSHKIGVSQTNQWGNYSYFNPSSERTDIDALIIVRMLKSTSEFMIEGNGEDEVVINLIDHIETRKKIVDNVKNRKFGFTSGDPILSDPGYAFTASEVFDIYNKSENKVGCNFGTQLVFMPPQDLMIEEQRDGDNSAIWSRKNDGVWIPGDWGYIKNAEYDILWPKVLEGQNVIYMGYVDGKEKFWGHSSVYDRSIGWKDRIYTESQWFNLMINTWHNYAPLSYLFLDESAAPVWKTAILTPQTGLSRIRN